jgi:hypothetical protein
LWMPTAHRSSPANLICFSFRMTNHGKKLKMPRHSSDSTTKLFLIQKMSTMWGKLMWFISLACHSSSFFIF